MSLVKTINEGIDYSFFRILKDETMINWRQVYNESQAIKPEDTSISTERICRLVNIYKNDMIEQDLHRYAQRLSIFSRCCQTCTSKSYTMYKWLDTYISGDKNLFDFHLSGRSVSALVYYWNKPLLLKLHNERGQLSDFKQNHDHSYCLDACFMSSLSNINENIIIKKHFLRYIIPDFIDRLITRFQMFYTYRKARSVSSSMQVHIQPIKSFRFLFQTNISPIFICFTNEDNNLRQLFWIFRHFITIFNWPLTTKIFSNRSFQKASILERTMANLLGFIDLSSLNMNQTDPFCYLYRCLKSCHQNGPMIFLFDHSTISSPARSDYYLMSFLFDLIRFDLSIPDLMVIPTQLYRSDLSFSQPYLLKELLEFFIKKFNIQKQFCELIKSEDEKVIYKLIDCIFLHLAYDTNQLIPTKIEFQHVIASIELCQMPMNPPITVETIFNTLQIILKTCPFIVADNHKWNEITKEHIEQYHSKLDIYKSIQHLNSQSKLISVVRGEYFLEILSALSILSNIQHFNNISLIFESDMFNQMSFLLFTFGNKQFLNIRSCQNINQIIQQTIQHCQIRNYILMDYTPQKSMVFRDTILSDHEWSDEDDDEMNEEFDDRDDDDIVINDLSDKTSEIMKSYYRINYQENSYQLKFFARLLGSYIEAVVHILKYHIEKQSKFFTLEEYDFNQLYTFNETSYVISNDILSFVRRAYAYRSLVHTDLFNETPMIFEPIDDSIYPLSMDNLVSLYDEFVKLLDCCCF